MILTVTLNPAVDHTLRLQESLNPDTVLRTNDVRFDAGGKGINVSKYLDALDTETIATGFLGGFLGSFVDERLTADGITHNFVQVSDLTRLNTTVLADEEYKINHTGPTVNASMIDTIIERIDSYEPETVVVAGSLPPGLGVGAIDQIANAGNWETVVDIGGEMLHQLSETYTICKPNREELAAATGQPTDTLEECFTAAEALRTDGFDRVIASLGADGAILVSQTEMLHAPAIDTEVVDTVGAGDALLAGTLAAFARGAPHEEALRTGIAAASHVVSVPGTTIPSISAIRTDADRISVSTY